MEQRRNANHENASYQSPTQTRYAHYSPPYHAHRGNPPTPAPLPLLPQAQLHYGQPPSPSTPRATVPNGGPPYSRNAYYDPTSDQAERHRSRSLLQHSGRSPVVNVSSYVSSAVGDRTVETEPLGQSRNPYSYSERPVLEGPTYPGQHSPRSSHFSGPSSQYLYATASQAPQLPAHSSHPRSPEMVKNQNGHPRNAANTPPDRRERSQPPRVSFMPPACVTSARRAHRKSDRLTADRSDVLLQHTLSTCTCAQTFYSP